MSFDQRPPSPFDFDDEHSHHPLSLSQTQQPDSPRLGILHLLVLTVCVAMYMGAMQVVLRNYPRIGPSPVGLDAYIAARGTLVGIGGGAALAGLVLWIGRRWRGMAFPVRPGEFLLVMAGVQQVLHLAQFYVVITALRNTDDWALKHPAWGIVWGFQIAALLIIAAVWLWVLVKVKVIPGRTGSVLWSEPGSDSRQ